MPRAKPKPESLVTCTDSGLEPGTYEYKVTALWSSWSKTSAVSSAKVTVGKVVKFTITGSTASPATGAGVNLTITAKDSAGATVTSYTGSHSFVFAGRRKPATKAKRRPSSTPPARRPPSAARPR